MLSSVVPARARERGRDAEALRRSLFSGGTVALAAPPAALATLGVLSEVSPSLLPSINQVTSSRRGVSGPEKAARPVRPLPGLVGPNGGASLASSGMGSRPRRRRPLLPAPAAVAGDDPFHLHVGADPMGLKGRGGWGALPPSAWHAAVVVDNAPSSADGSLRLLRLSVSEEPCESPEGEGGAGEGDGDSSSPSPTLAGSEAASSRRLRPSSRAAGRGVRPWLDAHLAPGQFVGLRSPPDDDDDDGRPSVPPRAHMLASPPTRTRASSADLSARSGSLCDYSSVTIHPSIHPSIHLSIRPSVPPSINPSIHPTSVSPLLTPPSVPPSLCPSLRCSLCPLPPSLSLTPHPRRPCARS